VSKNLVKVALPLFLLVCMLCAAMPAQAKVSAQEAEKLKKELTPMGASVPETPKAQFRPGKGVSPRFPRMSNMTLHPEKSSPIRLAMTRYRSPLPLRTWISTRIS